LKAINQTKQHSRRVKILLFPRHTIKKPNEPNSSSSSSGEFPRIQKQKIVSKKKNRIKLSRNINKIE